MKLSTVTGTRTACCAKSGRLSIEGRAQIFIAAVVKPPMPASICVSFAARHGFDGTVSGGLSRFFPAGRHDRPVGRLQGGMVHPA
jgi:hypothetical protein